MVICHGDDFLQYLGYKKDGPVKTNFEFENKISNINEQNNYGESLIFVASYFCEVEMVSQLLRRGADPNIPNHEGNTALHAAAYFDNIKLLQILVESGGDLRLVNNDGLKPCQLFKNLKNSQKIRSFEKNLFQSFRNQLSSNLYPIIIPQRKNTILNNFPKINRIHHQKAVSPYFTHQSGFGNYFCINKIIKGVVSSIKIIVNSISLTNDMNSSDQDIPCGLHTKIVNMILSSYPVSVKVLNLTENKENALDRRTNVLTNQFINEINVLGSLRHPDLLLLLCVNLIVDEVACSVQHQLIFERCEEGTIYHYLHTQNQEFEYCHLLAILHHLAEALSFLKSENVVHCVISSHSVYLINRKTAKLGNFENSVKINNSVEKKSQLSSQLWNFHNSHSGVDNMFKWFAPEVLNGTFVVNPSIDLYGFAVVAWESFVHLIPHKNRTYKSILQRYVNPFSNELSYRIPEPLRELLQQAFKQNPQQRPQLCTIQSVIIDTKKYINMEKKSSEIKPSIRESRELESRTESRIIGVQKGSLDVSTDTKETIYSKVSSSSIKSKSVNCLQESDSSFEMKIERLNNNQEKINSNRFGYRDLAALPNPEMSENNWKYPSPQTEVVIEGRGNLSNSIHRNSIIRGIKPASHQTNLSTSQTNICTILGTADLIKSSSRGSLQKNLSSNSLNKKTMVEANRKKIISCYKQLNFEKLKDLPNHKSNIANLIQKYENYEYHPYSSSNCSTPKALADKTFVLSNKSPSKFNDCQSIPSSSTSKGSTFSPSSSSSVSNKKQFFFPLALKQDKWELSSTTDAENSRDLKLKKSNFQKAKHFDDITNRFNYNAF